MGYRYMTTHDLKEIFRRWHAGHSISSIKQALHFDRNTIRNYIRFFETAGYSPGCPVPEEQKLLSLCKSMLPLKARPRSIRKVFEEHKEEIIHLVTRTREPVKPKTAFFIIKGKYDLPGSYETFKLYMREQAFEITRRDAPLRIELPPGKEIQLDYGKVGTIHDPVENRNRTVWAFCGKLSFSRLLFIEFVYAQDQESFVESNINMVEFFGGTTDFLSTDNLKAAVIKPDVYDPRLNRAYAEFAEHYGTFIDPCRVGRGEDKGKIERSIPSARELFRRLKEIHPTFTLAELNTEALRWCREEYGKAKQGTTGIPPLTLFLEEEQQYLKKLPDTGFEVPVWKQATVHRDRFFVFQGKYYAMPYEYRGKRLTIRKSRSLLRVFDADFMLIREYVITGKRFSWLPGDFPDDREALMQGAYPQWLLNFARSFGPVTVKLIHAVLQPHAYTNARRARGILSALEKYRAHPFLQEICGKALEKRIRTPKQIVQMLEAETRQYHFDFIIPMSDKGKAMIRDVKEYFN